LQELCASGSLPSSVCDGLTPDRVPAICPVLVGVSVEYAGRTCDELERNEFCYGYETVDVSPSGLVSEPGQISELTPVVTLDADAFNLRNAIYGITAVNAHANLPLEIGDETGLRMILFGELEMRNRVSSAEAIVLPEEAVTVTVNAEADLFNALILLGEENVIGTASAGETLMADTISADGEWVRVMFTTEREIGTDASGWISTDAIDFADDSDLSLLAIADVDSFTPLQNFYFDNGGTGGPECQPGTGSVLFLQAPEGIRTDYIANEAPLTIIGSVTMRLIRNNTQMEITTLSGVSILYNGDDAEDVILPAGYASVIDVVPSNGFYAVADDAEWESARDLTRTEINNITYYESLPLTLINQPVNVPECGADSSGETCDITYDDTTDANLVTELCADGILPDDLSICE